MWEYIKLSFQTNVSWQEGLVETYCIWSEKKSLILDEIPVLYTDKIYILFVIQGGLFSTYFPLCAIFELLLSIIVDDRIKYKNVLLLW